MDLFGITIIAGALTGSYWLGYYVARRKTEVDNLLGEVDGKTKSEFIKHLEEWAIFAWKNNDEIKSCVRVWANASELPDNKEEITQARTALRNAIRRNLPKRAKVEAVLFDMSMFSVGSIILRKIAWYRGIDNES